MWTSSSRQYELVIDSLKLIGEKQAKAASSSKLPHASDPGSVVRNKQGHKAWGYSSPLSVGDEFYEQHHPVGDRRKYVVVGNQSRSNMMTELT